jgi:hypothetical protein
MLDELGEEGGFTKNSLRALCGEAGGKLDGKRSEEDSPDRSRAAGGGVAAVRAAAASNSASPGPGDGRGDG